MGGLSGRVFGTYINMETLRGFGPKSLTSVRVDERAWPNTATSPERDTTAESKREYMVKSTCQKDKERLRMRHIYPLLVISVPNCIKFILSIAKSLLHCISRHLYSRCM